MNNQGPMSQEARLRLSEALKRKWASGTRKPNPPETYVKSSASLKLAYVEGRHHAPVLPREHYVNARAKRDPEKVAAINKELGKRRIGKLNPPGPSARGEGHFKSKYWILRTPDLRTIAGVNLNELVRKNAHLFEPQDLVWKNSACKATKRLRSLFEMRKDGAGAKVHTWKGWSIGDRRDISGDIQGT